MSSIATARFSRRSFLAAGTVGIAGLALPASTARVTTGRVGGGSDAAPPGFPHQDPALVEQTVRVSHFDLDAVRELVSARPALAKASWDWGFGDWETGLGAASHVGRRDIAEYLLDNGARPNLFTFAMLGEIDAVRSMIEARPGIQSITGPHGLTLMHHARAGGDAAASVVAYLEELGDADPTATDLPLTEGQRQAYLGTYRLDAADPESFEIIERGEGIAFRFGEEAPRSLMNQGDGVFHPVGAPAVRLNFEMRTGRAARVVIRDGGGTITASRRS